MLSLKAKVYMKKATLLILLITCGCNYLSAEERQIADDAVVSLKKVSAATQAGVDYEGYTQLLAEAKRKVSEAESIMKVSKLRQDINRAFATYEDARQVWSEKDASQGYITPSEGIGKIVFSRYYLTEKLTPASGESYDGNAILKILFAEAAKHIESASSLLKE